MARVTRVAPHLTVEQVKQKLHSATSIWLRERWLVIYTAMLEPRRNVSSSVRQFRSEFKDDRLARIDRA